MAKLQTMCKGRDYFFHVELYVPKSVDDNFSRTISSVLVFGSSSCASRSIPAGRLDFAQGVSPLPEHEVGRSINIVQRYVWLNDKCTQSYAKHRTELMELQCLRGSMAAAGDRPDEGAAWRAWQKTPTACRRTIATLSAWKDSSAQMDHQGQRGRRCS